MFCKGFSDRLLAPMPLAVTAAFFGFAVAASGCKTGTASAGKDAEGGDANLYCKFSAASGSHETFQLWATPSAGLLTNVGYDHAKTAAAASSSPTVTLGTLNPISATVVTASGQRAIRALDKSVLAVDFNQYSCYQLEGQSTPTVSYFCLANVAANRSGQQIGLIATNRNVNPYARDLTAFATTCHR